MSTNIPKKTSSPYGVEILDKIQEFVNFKVYPKGYHFSVNITQPERVYLIQSGVMSIHKRPDDLLLWVFEGPALRATLPSPHVNLELDFKAITPVKIAIVDFHDFCDLLTRFNLWEQYARHLQQTAMVVLDHLVKLTQPTAYEVIRTQLIELMAEPDEIRLNMTIENYIRNKTKISRSAVMNILAQLKSGEYITTHRGILVNIAKLPHKF